MLRGRQRHRESSDLLNQDCVLGITNTREFDSNIVMPIDALPNDLDALRALVSSLSSERDAAIEECRRVTEQNDRLHHLLRQLQRAQFGRRSERLDPDQMQLALEDIETGDRRAGCGRGQEGQRRKSRPIPRRSVAPTADRCRLIFRASTSRSRPRARSVRAAMARCTSSGRTLPSVST